MITLAERQDEFARAILDPSSAVPVGLTCPVASSSEERFAIYRNNVAVGLIEALRSTFLVVNQLVGAEFFGAMAKLYALDNPPLSPVLLAYGRDFPAFVAGFEPVAALPYLADVARLEWLWLEAFHASDAPALSIENLRSVPVDRLPELRLIIHPATRYARFAYSALAIWNAHQGDKPPTGINLDETPERLLFIRPMARIEVIVLSIGAFSFLRRIERGGTIAEGVSAALAEEPGLMVADMLSFLFGAGAFTNFIVNSDQKGRTRL